MNHYFKKDFKLSYLKTSSDVEIDLIIERPGRKTILVEIKSSPNITPEQISSFQKISLDIQNSNAYCFSLDKVSKKIENVNCLHWTEGINILFK